MVAVSKYSFGTGSYLLPQTPDKEQKTYAPQMQQPQKDSFFKTPKDGRNFWEKALAPAIVISSVLMIVMSIANGARARKAQAELAERFKKAGEDAVNSLGNKLDYESVFTNYKNDKSIPSLKDLPGMKEEKEIFQRDLIDVMKYDDIFKTVDAESVNAAVLHGPAGTGKSHLIKVIAKELDADVAPFSISKDGSPFRDQDAINVRNRADFVIKTARQNPNKLHIAFFDELESILTRDKLRNDPGAEKLIKTLLIILDDFKDIPNIRVLAATNQELNKATGLFENMDGPAMDRFALKIFIDNPDKEARSGALKYHLKGNKLAAELVQNQTAIDELADDLEGYSHRNIWQITNSAKRFLAKDIISARTAKQSEDIPMTKNYFDKAITEFKKSKAPETKAKVAVADYIENISNPANPANPYENFMGNWMESMTEMFQGLFGGAKEGGAIPQRKLSKNINQIEQYLNSALGENPEESKIIDTARSLLSRFSKEEGSEFVDLIGRRKVSEGIMDKITDIYLDKFFPAQK